MPDEPQVDAIIVGGGPAGLRAAEILVGSGHRVVLCDGKPSVGRKFLVAGRGGLNLTHSENLDAFAARYGDADPARWRGLLAEFGPEDLRAWAAGLGVETYVGTSGRVFPRGQQAAGLLRRWVARLREAGVEFRVNHSLAGISSAAASGGGWRLGMRETRTGEIRSLTARAVVLAMGGASWPQTGSDGRWPALLRGALGVETRAWQPANCGWEIAWDARVLDAAEGQPIKNITLSAGGRTISGEALITRYGLEGGALYQLGPELRAMASPRLCIDFKPGVSAERLLARLPPVAAAWEEICRSWRLGTAARALLEFHGPGSGADGRTLADWVKRFPLDLRGPRPVAEAISSAGGVPWSELDGDHLMLARHPGIFLAGEMIDWEAPTGGYLLQGCFATGTRAGRGAVRYLGQGKISRDTLPSA